MSTPCELQLYCDNKGLSDSCANDILLECKRLEKKYNYYDANSYLSDINNRKINILDSETKQLISNAKQYYKKTNTIFDITLVTIKKNKKLIAYVGCDKFEIKKNKLYFANSYTKIDLGGFVKEYSVNQAIKIIKKYKIKSAIVNFGGDLYVHGKKPNNDKFVVGIKNPKNPTENLISIALENEALATSALYERQGHILSKEKLNTYILSATVISNCCIKSGVYSTSFMINNDLDIKMKYYLINKNLEVIK